MTEYSDNDQHKKRSQKIKIINKNIKKILDIKRKPQYNKDNKRREEKETNNQK